MAVYEFIAKRENGENVRGHIDAKNEKEVVDILLDKKLYPISVRPQKGRGLSREIDLPFLNKIKVKDLVIFSRQLAVMVEATLPLVQSLKIIAEQIENPKLKSVVVDLAASVEGGEKFSQALAKHKDVFSHFFISMVKSGETSGRLDEVLNYLADQQERDYDLMTKIRGEMIYPIFIISVLVIMGFVMMAFVVPRITSMLVETGAELPLPTRILIFLSDFISGYWWVIVLITIAIFAGIRYSLRDNNVRAAWDRMKLRIPIFGKLFRNIYLVRISRSLVTMINGGIPLSQALEVTSTIVDNGVYKQVILDTKKEVDDGNPLAAALVKSEHIPSLFSQMISVGEQTGRLDKVLDKLTNFYSREVESMVMGLVSLIEPLIIVLIGLGVGVMVAAIILPMYNLASSF